MEYTKSKYTGSYDINNKFTSTGTFTFPNGTTRYEGSFHNGHFHGAGVLYFDGGRYVGNWLKGVKSKGDYIFDDHLIYVEENGDQDGNGGEKKEWDYLNGTTDRRFNTERATGKLEGSGESQLNNRNYDSRNDLKDGCFDAGDGYYDSLGDCKMHSFKDGRVIREVEEEEREFIVNKAASSRNTSLGKEPEREDLNVDESDNDDNDEDE